MSRRPFGKVVLCSTHDFGGDRNSQIQRWVESNGGRYSSSITPEVTHLVATKQAFRQQVDLVRDARRSKKTKIVTFDWFEDSLLRKSRKPLPTDTYEHEDQKRRTRKKRQNRQLKGGIVVKNGTDEAEKKTKQQQQQYIEISNSEAKSGNDTAAAAGPCAEIAKYGAALDQEARRNELDWKMDGYHIYRDGNGFAYAINLVRQDILAKFCERCMIKVGCSSLRFNAWSSYSAPSAAGARDDVLREARISYESGHQQQHHHHHQLMIPSLSFPHNTPFSSYRCIPSSLPAHLNASTNPELKVHVFNPWAQCLQVFESDDDHNRDDDDHATGSKPHTYAAECRYLDRNGEVHSLMVAPRGSSLDLTMDLFRRYFRNRCGVEWGSERDGEGKTGGECFVYEAVAEAEASGST